MVIYSLLFNKSKNGFDSERIQELSLPMIFMAKDRRSLIKLLCSLLFQLMSGPEIWTDQGILSLSYTHTQWEIVRAKHVNRNSDVFSLNGTANKEKGGTAEESKLLIERCEANFAKISRVKLRSRLFCANWWPA